MPGLGHVSKANLFMESTAAYGTRVTTNGSAIEVNSIGIDIDQGVVASKAIYNGLSARALYQMGIKYVGKISGEMRYEGLMKLLAAAFGGVPSTTGSGTLGYTHTFGVKEGTGVNAGIVPALCMEVDEGGIYDGAGDCTLIAGIVIPRLKLSVASGQGEDAIVMFEADVLAKDKTPATTATFTSTSAASQTPIFYHYGVAADLIDGTGDTGGTQNVTKISVELVNKFAERYFIAGPSGKSMAQPIRNGQVEVFWELTQEFQNYNQFKAAKAFTDGALKVGFLSPDSIPATSPTAYYKLTLSTPKAKCLDYKNDISEWGIMEGTSRWQAYHDTGISGPLQAILVNGKSSANVAAA